MLGEVADGLGPIPGGRGLGQQPFYPAHNQKGGHRFWGGCVWVGATCRRREVYLFPQVFCCRVWLGFPTVKGMRLKITIFPCVFFAAKQHLVRGINHFRRY